MLQIRPQQNISYPNNAVTTTTANLPLQTAFYFISSASKTIVTQFHSSSIRKRAYTNMLQKTASYKIVHGMSTCKRIPSRRNNVFCFTHQPNMRTHCTEQTVFSCRNIQSLAATYWIALKQITINRHCKQCSSPPCLWRLQPASQPSIHLMWRRRGGSMYKIWALVSPAMHTHAIVCLFVVVFNQHCYPSNPSIYTSMPLTYLHRYVL